MKCFLNALRLFGVALVFAALSIPAPAQDPGQPSKIDAPARIPELDELAARIANQVQKVPRAEDGKLKVAVFVFQNPDGSTSRLGAFLSNSLAAALALHMDKIEFIDQPQVTQMGIAAGLSAKDIADDDIARYLAEKAGATILIAGSFQTADKAVKVSVMVSASKTHKVLGLSNATFPLLAEWQSLASLPAVSLPAEASHPSTGNEASPALSEPGKDRVSYPECAQCPTPRYSPDARDAKYQGTVILEIVVSAEGNAENIRVVQPLGLGLTEQAILAVKKWKFKPARGSDGKAVPVEVTIEVTFRLLK